MHYSIVYGRENEPWNEEDMFSWTVISLVCVDNKEDSTNRGTFSRIRRQQVILHNSSIVPPCNSTKKKNNNNSNSGRDRYSAKSTLPKDTGRFPFDQKFLKRGQMVRKFPGKSSRKSGNCWISEKRTIQPKIPEISVWKSNGKELSMKKIREFGYTSRGCPRFRNLCKVPTYYSARASSFGRDRSQLDISRKDGGDAHSVKETL